MNPSDSLRRFHGVLGLVTLLVFLLTGAYMKFVAHPDQLPDGRHLMFLSRHIYILAAALVHLALAAYVVQFEACACRTVQWIGAALLGASSLLLIAAFAVEPMSGRARTLTSSFGLYALLAGTLLHVIAAARQTSRK